MADKIILVDTSILIDLFRKTDKTNAKLISLVRQGYIYCISAVTEYEIYTGATFTQYSFWDSLLEKIQVLPFDHTVVSVAVDINSNLKHKRKQIDLADLFIAATAVSYSYPLATLNRKHFERIDKLQVME